MRPLVTLALVLAIGATAHAMRGEPGGAAHAAAVFLSREVGVRPAASAAELRAHRWIRDRFEAAGLEVAFTRFTVPRRGRSRNVVGVHRGEGRCLKILMAHTDSVAEGPGAIDNASGVGVLVGLAPRLKAVRTPCEVWLVATGAEERGFTRMPDHLGALRLVHEVRRRGLARRLRYALSLDMVGRGRRFTLRSPRARARRAVEGDVFAAGRRRGVPLRWMRDSATGNSDHREFELAGLPGLVMELWNGTADDRCYHSACDRAGRLDPVSLGLAQGLAESLVRQP